MESINTEWCYDDFLVSRPCGAAGWLALFFIKSGDVETNPGPTTSHKRVWICDICHKEIHVRKQISISFNMIEQWVHLRCASIRQSQYTDTWTCHLHRESGLTYHIDITPPPTYITHTTATQIQTHVQHSLCSHSTGKAQTQSSHPLIHESPLHTRRPEQNTYTSHILHQLLSSHAPHSSIARQLR